MTTLLLFVGLDINLLKMKRNSLNREIWKYFFLFSIVILGFLWTFQVLFLNQFYKHIKINDIQSVAKTIEKNKNSDRLETIINNAAFDRSVCIEVVDGNLSTVYSSSFVGKGCFTGKEERIRYKYDFILSNEEQTTYQLINPQFDNQTLVYALKLAEGQYAFINTSLEPIDSTVGILTSQLIIVTIIVLILSFVIAYFISKYISDPIVKINRAAKKLATGELNVVFNSGTNISELEELEHTLNYTRDELSKTEELRRDLMANVSHDLKTPLTMIKAYAEMSRDLHVNNKKKREENMNIVIDEVDRLTLLVNDILTLSSVQSEIEQLHRESFDFIQMIESILKRYQIFQETENYHFIFQHTENELFIEADKIKMEQVVYNLVNNAINYTGKDNLVTIDVQSSTEGILVEIKDTGKGIKEEELPYIWDRYYKNKMKHKRNLIGTGLGLSIVKNILQLHQFQYGVHSIKNQGSTFYFIIPKENEQ